MTYETEERPLGTRVHILDGDKAAAFIKKKLDAPDVPLWLDPMVILNGEDGLATLIDQGVGWYVDEHGFVPINYSGPADLSDYLDITLEELVPLISDETIDLAEFIFSSTEKQETNFYLWHYIAKDYPQDKTSLIARAENPPAFKKIEDQD